MSVPYRRADGMCQQLQAEIRTRFGGREQNKGFVTGYPESARDGQTGGHFPDRHGVAHAYDIGVDIEADGTGLEVGDALWLAEHLRRLGAAGRHPFSRRGYVIHDLSRTTTPEPRIAGFHTDWTWTAYAGTSPHSDHIHVTTGGDQQWGGAPQVPPSVYDSREPYGIADAASPLPSQIAGYTRPVPDGVRVSQDWKDNPTAVLPPDHWLIRTFGNYQPNGHTGRDYDCRRGTDVYAVGPGTVLWADWATKLPGDDSHAGWACRWYIAKNFAGIVVVVDHGPFLGVYAHLEETRLNAGDTVAQGQRIARSGNTGGSTGPHLHFEVIPTAFEWHNGMFGRVDPDAYLKLGPVVVTLGHTGGTTGGTTPLDPLEEIMAWYKNRQEFERAISKAVLDQKFETADRKKRTSLAAEIAWNPQNFAQVNAKLDAVAKAAEEFLAGREAQPLDYEKLGRAVAEALQKEH
ncbi:M23 family metallopeptidase [Kocuria sp. M1R5S2]|uniref:M23 family metallopeptidase n=1 Tax=Kocuria rhizosphaerae TaxID=3376285 RepID=UPI0037AAEEF0